MENRVNVTLDGEKMPDERSETLLVQVFNRDDLQSWRSYGGIKPMKHMMKEQEAERRRDDCVIEGS